ncbi:DMT family transporter [Rhodosalinus sediminis]|uniref:DMT family transporter n=1 Tax=Rhodosalinus sediminis TaxID=1940533 RepID=A0A3D9BZF5_9RHOB|nr:DMT family transporter [Rhodosalinus sediminis]REC58731.1 DMT family transporter [Rhodosalinus sediminis]
MRALDGFGHRGTVGLTLLASLLWGVWWIPIRWLESGGLPGVWASLAMGLAALPAFAVLAAREGAGGLTAPRALAGALCVGLAAMLYSTALVFTDVVRAVVIFYLAPAWSILIECLFMGRRWSLRSAGALALSLLGVAAIFRFDVAADRWAAGDAIALVSGLAWAVGAALVFARPGGRPATLALFATLGMVAAAAGVLALSGGAAGRWPGGGPALAATPLALATGLFYLAPVLLVTLWAAQRLAPAAMSFLLTAEIVAGVVSGAVLLAEPFGWPEAAGAGLIILGALVEAGAPVGAARRSG